MATISERITTLRLSCAPSKSRELGNQHAFDSLRESELIPGPNASTEEIQELARLASASFGHAVGNSKMGVDKLAVVDPELRVHGILGLRVADASVMPRIIPGPGARVYSHDRVLRIVYHLGLTTLLGRQADGENSCNLD